MFGAYQAGSKTKKEKKPKVDYAKQQQDLADQAAAMFKNKENEEAATQKQQFAEKTQQAKEDRTQARAEGKKYAEEVLGRKKQGLTPEERQALQSEAYKGIERSMEGANRKLLGEQSLHGIVGKGGVGYAQRRDLQRMGDEAKQQAERDITGLNAKRELQNLAAAIALEQGEASQSQLDKQLAMDELNLLEEKKKQKKLEDHISQLFDRI